MGYPEGINGYRLRDKETNMFFVARDVIFNKNFASTVSVIDDSDSDVEDSHSPPVTVPIPLPSSSAPTLPASVSPPVL
jgi:hypothetical protein